MRKDVPRYIIDLSKELRRNETQSETILWQRLRGNRLKGFKFKRQYAIGRYIADFYCSKAELVVEIDGNIHDVEAQIRYDILRENELRARKISVLRFSNEQVLTKMEEVLRAIECEIIKIISMKSD